MLFAFFACTSDGDDALVVEPYYTNYNSVRDDGRRAPRAAARRAARTASTCRRARPGKRALTPRTRLVLLCNPNNPTGTVYRRDELETVAAFCRDHGLFLVADEVYREFVYDGRAAIGVLTLPGLRGAR